MKKILIITEILFLIIASGILIAVAIEQHNSLGIWGYACAIIWCLGCLIRDIEL